ncbi:MAG TPA: hypothetical protein VMW10_01120, partial [Alphaproteobacteria bacterium]|nr:hypothetical protein [Alphaproteobacteria bacterium]
MTQPSVHHSAYHKASNIKNKSPFILYLVGVLFILGGTYSIIQYMVFSAAYQHTFLQKTQVLEKSFNTTLEKYKRALYEFSKEIKKKSLFLDSSKLSNLFEKSYTYGVAESNGEKIHISAINWVDTGGGPAVGRFGTLLYKLNFSTEYLKNLKKNPGNLEISDPELERHSTPSIANLGIGVEDDLGMYRGFVNVRVNTDTLLERVAAVSQEDNIQVILLDKNSQVLSSSISLTFDDKRELLQRAKDHNKANFSKENYTFTESISVNGYPFSLLFGYSIKKFYMEFFNYIFPQLIGIMLFSAIIIFFSYFYHIDKLQQGLKSFRRKIKDLNELTYKLSEQNHQLSKKRKELEEDLKRREKAAREERRFRLEVNTRISEATSDLLNAGNVLLERVKYQEELKDNPQEVMDIFEKAYLHACFACARSQESQVNIINMIDDSIKIHSNKIGSNNININKKLDENIRSVLT